MQSLDKEKLLWEAKLAQANTELDEAKDEVYVQKCRHRKLVQQHLNEVNENEQILKNYNELSCICPCRDISRIGSRFSVLGDMSYFGDMSSCRRDKTGHTDPYSGGLMSCRVITVKTCCL